MKKLLSADEISEGVAGLAEQISRDFAGRPLTIVGVLTGCVVMLADLIRLVDLPLRLGWVQARSYRGTATVGGVLTPRSGFPVMRRTGRGCTCEFTRPVAAKTPTPSFVAKTSTKNPPPRVDGLLAERVCTTYAACFGWKEPAAAGRRVRMSHDGFTRHLRLPIGFGCSWLSVYATGFRRRR